MENFENLKVLLDRFDGIVKKIQTATAQETVTEAEREGTHLMREIQLVAPRIWEDFLAVDRARRNEISQGLVQTPKVEEPKEEPKVEEEKPKKKKTTKRKKKTTKK